MKLKNLNLLYFRNYDFININLHPSLNILVGDNANGKTNIIESIFFLSLGRSFRTKKDTECIKFGEEATCMSCTLQNNHTEKDIMLAISQKGKNAKISGIKKSKLTDFVGELNIVLFSPEDLQLVKGSPSLRRDFIDREFYQISRIYHKYSLTYKHLLKQRNTFLKEMRKNRNDEVSKMYLETLTLQLSKLAIYITKERVNFIKRINSFAYDTMLNISDNKEKLRIIYKSSVMDELRLNNIESSEFNENKLTEAMMKKMHDDINNGSTKIGIHHDDLIFFLNDKDAKKYASQGQQRSIVLSLRLAEIYFLKEKTGEYPILLLDDVLSELDKNRQEKMLSIINNDVQTFITTPSVNELTKDLLDNSIVFRINNGIISKDMN
ncbi:DNA replication/repair protein RecF [Gemella sp. GH3]|uniref:DNA replication/repair protein RecF n=1 Tax=unclassified Gemella TaxID=2624949 RepID=UPI0015CF99BC|nr:MULTISPECIES: DNA replication/repair protein RecF [unclassified Gemella]MBF0714314.1 DNA replication/repair protein RecF [Gemella sp. GH3.1]NYS51266.1 DNA replication/repair protein RecF [Gemella sp. GH3]